MAHMIPDAYPPDTVSVAERELFTALQSGLGDDFTVIHSLPWLDDTRRNLQQGECDFVILHPQYGLLALEAKSGEVHYDGPSGQWHRRDGTRLKKDPFRQAQSSAHYLHKILKRDVGGWHQVDPPYGYAVAFPDTDRMQGAIPLHVKPTIVIFEPELERLEDRIREILASFKKPRNRMGAKMFREVVDRLLPEFQVVRSLSQSLADQETGLNRLTSQQIKLLESMRKCRRLLIEGCAGSGKTLLAVEKAIRLAREGLKVLLVCFNIPLAEWLRERVAASQSDVAVFHFHGLCERVIKMTGGTFEVPDNSAEHFWKVDLPEQFFDALASYRYRYDALIVDEGQDFCRDWWIPLSEILVESQQSHFYIFYDPEQNIFGRDNVFPFGNGDPSMVLDTNCRNTCEIARYVHELIGVSYHPADFVVPGIAPIVHVVSSDEEEVAETDNVLKDLIDVEGIDPSRIVILGRRRLENSPYAHRPVLGGSQIVSEEDAQPPAACVRYATVYRFKGLEADCVIVTGFARPTTADCPRELYVAASRAKMLLHLMYRAS